MIFDKYVYGKCNLDLVESFRINQYLSVAYRASLALLKDSYNGDLLQENAFLISLGPDYAKFSLGYDTVRQRTLFNYAMLVGGENNDVKFDKLISYNPDKIAKKKEKQPKIWDNLGESLKNWGKKVPQDTDSMDEEEDITQNDIL